MMRQMLLAVVLVLILPVMMLAAEPFAFGDGLKDAEAFAKGWDAAFGYEVGAEGLRQETGVRQMAVVAKSPYGKKVTAEAVVSVKEAVASQWKTSGVAIVRDGGNFWHVTLCESPDSAGKEHTVDFHEMREDRWLAQYEDKLVALPRENLPAFRWEYNHPYRLRLVTDGKTIVATVEELDGTLRWKAGYAYGNGPAVMDGRPGLVSNGFRTTFRDFACTVDGVVPAPAERTYPAYTVKRESEARVRAEATGFFRMHKEGERSWVVDPNGAAMVYLSTDHVNYNVFHCEALGYAPYHRNVAAKYGGEEAWAKAAVTRLQEWGFNGLGAGASPSTHYRGLAHTEFVNFGGDFSALGEAYRIVYPDNGIPVPCSYFPNVFHPRFEAFCRRLAKERAGGRKNDPWLFGYFLDNELAWWGKTWGTRTGLFDACMKQPATHSAKLALVEWFKGRYGTAAGMARAWGAEVRSWEELLRATELVGTKTEQVARDKEAFVTLIAERYFETTTRALREVDPNHMILGCRFAGLDNPAYELAYAAAGKHCDVISVNIYEKVDLRTGEVYMQKPGAGGRVPLATVLDEVNQRCGGKPMMVTEWSYPAYDSGLPNKHGAGQRVDTQAQREFCFEAFQKLILSRPYMVGSSFFMWADEPALGISKAFPEDSNYGLVNEKDEPYALLTQTATRVHGLAVGIHAGKTAEVEVTAGETPGEFVLRNGGSAAGAYQLVLSVDGKVSRQEFSLQPGQVTRVTAGGAVQKPGGHMVECELRPMAGTAEVYGGDNRAMRTFVSPGLARGAGAKGFVVAVANPTIFGIPQQVITLRGAQLPGGIDWSKARVSASVEGKAVACQLDQLPEGPELAILVPQMPPASVQTVVVRESDVDAVKRTPVVCRVDGSRMEIDNGLLKLSRNTGEMIFDRVALREEEVGRFTGLLQQGTPKSVWVRPQTTSVTGVWNGPVRLVVDVTADAKSDYSYRMGWRVTVPWGQQWFTSRPLWVENRSDKVWTITAFLQYPLSRIKGNDADDEAAGAMWYDNGAKLGYGIIDPAGALKTTFWKDEGGAEHPDAVHAVGVELKPGERHALRTAAAYIAAFQGERVQAWQGAAATLGDVARCEVVVGAVEE